MRLGVWLAGMVTGALASAGLVGAACVGYLDVDAGAEDGSADGAESSASDGGTSDGAPSDGGVADAPSGDACAIHPYQCAVLASQPSLYLRFDEPIGSFTLVDSTGNVRDAGYPTAGVTLGVEGAILTEPTSHALFIDDEGGAPNFFMPPGYDFAGDAGVKFSIEIWLKAKQIAGQYGFIIDHDDWTAQRRGWDFLWFSEGNVELELWVDGGVVGVFGTYNAPSPPVTPNVWHHVVAAYDQMGPLTYVDGTRYAVGAVGGGALPSVPHWTIGKQNCIPCSGSEYIGGIDELAIYPRALSETEVRMHYKAAGYDAGL